MGVLFAGGEDICFTQVGAGNAVSTVTSYRRTAYSRCTLGAATSTSANGDGWYGAFSSASSSFWFTGRVYPLGGLNNLAGVKTLMFRSGSVSRIELRCKTLNTGDVGIYKVTSAGSATLLASASSNLVANTQFRFDVQINYSTSGFVRLYYGGTLVADTGTVDVTTDGATSLDGFVLGAFSASASSIPGQWSEIIASTDDTRSMSLLTVSPAAAGNSQTFDTNTVGNINEVTNSDATLISSATANQLAQYTITTPGAIGNPSVNAVSLWTRAQRGGTGPQSLQHAVRTSSTDSFSATKALSATMGQQVTTWDVNPVTGVYWTAAELSAAGFNIGVKSIA